MALLLTGKVIADTDVFIDYLRDTRSPEWIFGGTDRVVRRGFIAIPPIPIDQLSLVALSVLCTPGYSPHGRRAEAADGPCPTDNST